MSPRSTILPLYSCNLGSNSAFGGDIFVSLCASRKTSILALYFVQLPGWNRLELVPFLVHCCFRIQNFHRLRHRNWCVYQVVMSHRITSFAWDVIFMILRWSRFQTLPHGFMSFHDTCMLLSLGILLQSSLFASVSWSPECFFVPFCTAWPHPSWRLWWFLCTLHHPDRWIKCLSSFEHHQALVFQ